MTYSLIASFIIAAGWNWAHTARQPHWKFVTIAIVDWLVIFLSFWLLMYCYRKLTTRKHSYWQTFFYQKIPQMFFVISLFFLAFFSKNEIASLILALMLGLVLYWQTNGYLKKHPAGTDWQATNRSIFLFGILLFVFFSFIQYIAHVYYILDAQSPFRLTVLLRAAAMATFWLVGFVWAQALFERYTGSKRYFLLAVWAAGFTFMLVFWVANLGILFASGLYLSPVAIGQAAGASTVIFNKLTVISLIAATSCLAVFAYVITRITLAHKDHHNARHWHYYGHTTIWLGLAFVTMVAPITATPEVVVASYFYEHYFGKNETETIPSEIFDKLRENFGLTYRPDEFYVARRDTIFTEPKKLLPDRLQTAKPNIIIIFFESLSSKLTDVYTDTWHGELTPALKKFAEEKNTTVFKNYYNASTPTVTGILAQLCSFLPPTGHTEIDESGRLSRFYLRCLPNILRDEAGYRQALYVTGVEKDYANKDTIYGSIGVDKIYGSDELAKFIPGQPLGWGWTDHQMFSAVPKLLADMPEPFLFMLSTVDAHYPYTDSKDMGQFRDGKSVVLNSYHSTDDAFGQFWEAFKQSNRYNNTMVLAVADHAIFPGSFHNVPEYKDDPRYKQLSFYDENAFIAHIPDSILPKEVDVYSSSLDFSPTLLHLLGINAPTTFEGHSIFDDRKKYPNLVGMHEFGLYINQETHAGRKESYDLPAKLSGSCPDPQFPSSTTELSLCEYEQFYKWKRKMLEEGRLWTPRQ